MSVGLSSLLITPEMATFIKQADELIESTEEDRLGRWWVRMNQHEWPAWGTDDPIPLQFDGNWGQEQCGWAQKVVFDLLAAKLPVHVQTLYWRAAGNTNEAKARAAQAELDYRRELITQRQRTDNDKTFDGVIHGNGGGRFGLTLRS